MAQNMMNTTIKPHCQTLYEEEGLDAVRELAKEITAWCKATQEMEKRAAEQEKLRLAAEKAMKPTKSTKSWFKLADKSGKKLEKDAKKLSVQMKALVTLKRKAVEKAQKEAEAKAKPTKTDSVMMKRWSKLLSKEVKRGDAETKKVLAQLKKLKAEVAKGKKPSKADSVMMKRWSKLLSKEVKRGDAETKKALAQLKKLKTEVAKTKKTKKTKPTKADSVMMKRWGKVVTKHVKCGDSTTKKALAQLKKLKAKQSKAKPKAKSKAKSKKAVEETVVGDDLIATLLAKAKSEDPVVTPAPVVPCLALEISMAQLNLKQELELLEEKDEELKPDSVPTDLELYGEDDDEEVAVVRFEHNGVKYLKDADGYLFDPETQEEVAFWDGSAVVELEDEE